MTDWEIYTDGEYGHTFKFPWEVEATELTAVGHAIGRNRAFVLSRVGSRTACHADSTSRR